MGKYLNDYGARLDDTTPAFQPDHVPPGWDHWQALIGVGTYRMFKFKINDTRDGVQQVAAYTGETAENYQTTVLTRRAVSFIEDSHQLGAHVLPPGDDHNGWVCGHHRLVGKQLPYEESIRVPLYIRVPARRGASCRTWWSTRTSPPPSRSWQVPVPTDLWVDGRSLVPFLSADVPDIRWRRSLLVEHWGDNVPTYAALRTRRYVHVDYFESSPPMTELYDLEIDPFQLSNVQASPDYQGVVRHLERKLADMRGCALGSCQQLEEE